MFSQSRRNIVIPFVLVKGISHGNGLFLLTENLHIVSVRMDKHANLLC